MADRHVSVAFELEVLAWFLGLVGSTLAIFIDARIGAMGVSLCVAGATLTGCRRVAALDQHLQNAFTLGRDSVRSVR